MALLSVLIAPGLRFSTSSTRKKTAGDPVVTTALNARTIPDQYPVWYIADFAQLAGRRVFSTTDLEKANHQIPVHLDDIAKTAIITPFKLLEFPYTSFGI